MLCCFCLDIGLFIFSKYYICTCTVSTHVELGLQDIKSMVGLYLEARPEGVVCNSPRNTDQVARQA